MRRAHHIQGSTHQHVILRLPEAKRGPVHPGIGNQQLLQAAMGQQHVPGRVGILAALFRITLQQRK